MNHLACIKHRLKCAGKKVAVASTAICVSCSSAALAAIDTSATGSIGTAIAQGKTDYEAVFGMIIAAIVVFWALTQLKKVFFSS